MTKIVGHRGAGGYACENTLESFQAAISAACDRVEMDVRLTKDGEPVVIHDEDISRLTNGHGLVVDHTLLELKSLHCANGETIPTLKEVIDLCKGNIDLMIELKVMGAASKVHDLIAQHGLTEHTVVLSFSLAALREIKSFNPNIATGFLFEEYDARVWETIRNSAIEYICPKGKIVTQEMVHKAHSQGIKIYAYHVDEKKLGEKLIAFAVDEIGTDFPLLFTKNMVSYKA